MIHKQRRIIIISVLTGMMSFVLINILGFVGREGGLSRWNLVGEPPVEAVGLIGHEPCVVDALGDAYCWKMEPVPGDPQVNRWIKLQGYDDSIFDYELHLPCDTFDVPMPPFVVLDRVDDCGYEETSIAQESYALSNLNEVWSWKISALVASAVAWRVAAIVSIPIFALIVFILGNIYTRSRLPGVVEVLEDTEKSKL